MHMNGPKREAGEADVDLMANSGNIQLLYRFVVFLHFEAFCYVELLLRYHTVEEDLPGTCFGQYDLVIVDYSNVFAKQMATTVHTANVMVRDHRQIITEEHFAQDKVVNLYASVDEAGD